MANNRPIRHVRVRGWWPKRKRRSPGEYNIISEATAAAMGAATPFWDGSCAWNQTLDTGFPCDYTQPCPTVVLSSAAEGDLGGQPLWPKHTVESVRGEIHLFTAGLTDGANVTRPPGGLMVHMGIRKTRFDYDAVTPSFETDFDPGHEDDAEARWIWTKHVYIPPGAISDFSNTVLSDGSVGRWNLDFGGMCRNRASVMLNERNKVHLGENEGLVLVTSMSRDPWLSATAAQRPLGLIHANGAQLIFTSKLRTYVRQSGK